MVAEYMVAFLDVWDHGAEYLRENKALSVWMAVQMDGNGVGRVD